MAIKKALAGVEDITLGVGTETQLRNGKQVPITKVNADNIPYDHSQSIKRKMDNFTGEYQALRTTIERHISDMNNPHNVTIDTIGAAPVVHDHDGRYYREDEFIVASSGALDAGKPIVLANDGKIDPTIAPQGGGLYPVSNFTPTSGNEYPDTSGHQAGAYWMVEGVPDTGYTFTSGDLNGKVCYVGDLIILGSQSWLLRSFYDLADDYYRLDGSQAITAPFAGGGQQFKNALDGTDDSDLSTVGQMNASDNLVRQEFADADGTVRQEFADADAVLQNDLDSHKSDTSNPHHVTPSQIGAVALSDYGNEDVLNKIKSVDGSGSGLDADMVDGAHLVDIVAGKKSQEIETKDNGDLWLLLGEYKSPAANGSITETIMLNSRYGSGFVNVSASGTGTSIPDVSVESWVTGYKPGFIPKIYYTIEDNYLRVYAQLSDWEYMTCQLLASKIRNFVVEGRFTLNNSPIGTTVPARVVSVVDGSTYVVGEIKQYTGKLSDLPSGWHLCNGSKGTPDMTSDFKTYGDQEVIYIMYTGE